MRINLLILFFLLITSITKAANVDTVKVYSLSMNKNVEVVFIQPERKVHNKEHFPVVYLLHGYGGDAKSWLHIKPELPEISDKMGIVFVCPDGENSWYWDSPLNSSYRYETFISTELVQYTDENYPTIAKREGRAITGLSMGGHGALWNAIRHKDIFGAVGSTSGGVDIRPFPTKWDMNKQLGDFVRNHNLWEEHTVINLVKTLKNRELAIIIDCGEKDFFIEVNKNLHSWLLAHEIEHDFITRPGRHNGEYWNNSIDYQLIFFRKYFDKNNIY